MVEYPNPIVLKEKFLTWSMASFPVQPLVGSSVSPDTMNTLCCLLKSLLALNQFLTLAQPVLPLE